MKKGRINPSFIFLNEPTCKPSSVWNGYLSRRYIAMPLKPLFAAHRANV